MSFIDCKQMRRKRERVTTKKLVAELAYNEEKDFLLSTRTFNIYTLTSITINYSYEKHSDIDVCRSSFIDLWYNSFIDDLCCCCCCCCCCCMTACMYVRTFCIFFLSRYVYFSKGNASFACQYQ
jgi:hypothetical protein